jgi:hypothetical protein
VLLEWADGKTQSSLITHIKSTVRKQLFGDGIIANTQIDRELFDKAKGRLRNILLLANIAQQVNPQNKNRANEDNKAALQRFNLRAYIRESWDIEHIRSQTPTQDKKEWCKAILDYWGVTGAKDAAGDSLKEKVWNAVTGSATIEDALINEIENHFDGLSAGKEGEVNAGDFVDSLGNYCLLDASTNRSYGNAPFPVKRKTIIQRVQDGAFVPLVTQNVFLKVYSENTANMMQWTQDDAANYRQQMLNAISTFLGEQQ